jgi:hypothetical protein
MKTARFAPDSAPNRGTKRLPGSSYTHRLVGHPRQVAVAKRRSA